MMTKTNKSPCPAILFIDENDKSIYATVGKILCDRSRAENFSLKLSIAEISQRAGLSRPTIYKRTDIVEALAKFSYIDTTSEKSQKLDFNRKLLDIERAHKTQLENIATEKISLLAKITKLEGELADKETEIDFLKRRIRREV